MESNDWFFDKFEPEYPGDTPNRRWVRRKLNEREVPIDEIAVIKCLPDRHIRWMFDELIQHSYFGIKEL